MIQDQRRKIVNGYIYDIRQSVYVLKGFIFPIENFQSDNWVARKGVWLKW